MSDNINVVNVKVEDFVNDFLLHKEKMESFAKNIKNDRVVVYEQKDDLGKTVKIFNLVFCKRVVVLVIKDLIKSRYKIYKVDILNPEMIKDKLNAKDYKSLCEVISLCYQYYDWCKNLNKNYEIGVNYNNIKFGISFNALTSDSCVDERIKKAKSFVI